MTSPYVPSEDDLIHAVKAAIENNNPCWCGTPDEASCPHCETSSAGRDAFSELLRRHNIEE